MIKRYKTVQHGSVLIDENDAELIAVLGAVVENDAPATEKNKSELNAPILSQIAALEKEVTSRVWREYVSKPTVAGKGGKTPAQFIADIDAQIAVLRATLIA